jgi:hypothetical protein
MDWFTAAPHRGGTLLRWRTGAEANNLGFHLYRQDGNERVRLTPEPVAGSALMAASGRLGAGNVYNWWDSGPPGGSYWLEAINLNGERDWYGPAASRPALSPGTDVAGARSPVLSELNADDHRPAVAWERRRRVTAAGNWASGRGPRAPAGFRNEASALAGQAAVKIQVRSEGWYRLGQAELLAAGLPAAIDPRTLSLHADGQEIPILVRGEADQRFDPQDSVDFYGTGLDTASTDTRVYWLTWNGGLGRRILLGKAAARQPGGQSFPFALEIKERLLYFTAIKNGPAENWFGRIVMGQPVEFSLPVSRLAPGPDGALQLAVQGVTAGEHRVGVRFNGVGVGELVFSGQERGEGILPVPAALLHEGENTLTLVSEGGPQDINVIDVIRLTYPHTYTADNDALRFLARGGDRLVVGGFTRPDLVALDVTDPDSPERTPSNAAATGDGFVLKVTVPGKVGSPRVLVAMPADAARPPAGLRANVPSAWQGAYGADYLIITTAQLAPGLETLRARRQAQQLRVAVIDVEDVYDEFNWGAKDPAALRLFLAWAASRWTYRPRFVLLAGDASVDPRDYMGLGDTDLVPTGSVATVEMEASSDDWLVDFDDDALPQLAVGRLPARSAEQLAEMAAKILAYESAPAGREALLVADRKDTFDFAGASAMIRAVLPAGTAVTEVLVDAVGLAAARQQVLAALQAGPGLVSYLGHGSAEFWRGDLLTAADARLLTNGDRLPLLLAMTCLNGLFTNPGVDCLAEAMVGNPNGGAVAAWASSGLCEPDSQALIAREFVRLLSGGGPAATIGEAAARAKAATADPDVRRTWILFGDPAMRPR